MTVHPRDNFTLALRARFAVGLFAVVLLGHLGGCAVDSYFDPSKTGYFEHTPTTMPVLSRIGVIEEDTQQWGETTPPTPEDLLPNELIYRLSPGDILQIEVFGLTQAGRPEGFARLVNQSGNVRLAQAGDIQVAGLTEQQAQEAIGRALQEAGIVDPRVTVIAQQRRGFQYTVFGGIAGTGVYTLDRPNLRLLDALAAAGGVPLATEKIYIIRQVPLYDEVEPIYQQGATGSGQPPTRRPGGSQPGQQQGEPADIEDLIQSMDDEPTDQQDSQQQAQPQAQDQPRQQEQAPGARGDASQDEPLLDIDDLEPMESAEAPAEQTPPPTQPRTVERAGIEYEYLPESDKWVAKQDVDQTGQGLADLEPNGDTPLFLERIIKVPYQPLSRGESKYNIVIRPGDRIYVDFRGAGLVYIGGEIARTGVYDLPQTGRMTLSRFISVGGGLNPIAVPERVDLVRVVGDNREAVVRVDLAAIRNRTEPDIYLKPDDHIIIGTNWIASPLAVIRNGLRATYGFGFLLDRNFGNDVFGAPPSNNRF